MPLINSIYDKNRFLLNFFSMQIPGIADKGPMSLMPKEHLQIQHKNT